MKTAISILIYTSIIFGILICIQIYMVNETRLECTRVELEYQKIASTSQRVLTECYILTGKKYKK